MDKVENDVHEVFYANCPRTVHIGCVRPWKWRRGDLSSSTCQEVVTTTSRDVGEGRPVYSAQYHDPWWHSNVRPSSTVIYILRPVVTRHRLYKHILYYFTISAKLHGNGCTYIRRWLAHAVSLHKWSFSSYKLFAFSQIDWKYCCALLCEFTFHCCGTSWAWCSNRTLTFDL